MLDNLKPKLDCRTHKIQKFIMKVYVLILKEFLNFFP